MGRGVRGGGQNFFCLFSKIDETVGLQNRVYLGNGCEFSHAVFTIVFFMKFWIRISKDISDSTYFFRLKLSPKIRKISKVAIFWYFKTLFTLNLSLLEYILSLKSLDIRIQKSMKKTMVKTASKNSHPFPRYTQFCTPTVTKISESAQKRLN